MIDSHCHLDFDAFEPDRSDVIELAKKNGITHILVPGTRANTWSKQIQLGEQYPELYIALGLHPYFLDSAKESHIDSLDQLLSAHQTQVVGVGEIGLDFSIQTETTRQAYFFERQLDLAIHHHLPVIIHHRRSHNQIIQTLKRKQVTRGGVIHAFSGSLYEAQSYLDMGFLLGVGGTITYSRAQKTRKALAGVPLEGLLLETDAPDMPMEGKQGMRNSPVYLPAVLNALAAIRTETKAQIAHQTDVNFNRLFLSGRRIDNGDNEICKMRE